jgi:hypothetical protein
MQESEKENCVQIFGPSQETFTPSLRKGAASTFKTNRAKNLAPPSP